MPKRNNRIQFYWSRKDEIEIQDLIKKNINKKGIIWDPFMGSGSTLFAINLSTHKFIGTEINEMPFENLLFNLKKIPLSELDEARVILNKIEENYSKIYKFQLDSKHYLLEKVVFSSQEYSKITEVKLKDGNNKILIMKEGEISPNLSKAIIERYAKYKKLISRDALPNLEENSRIAVKNGMKISDIFSPLNFYLLVELKKSSFDNVIIKNIASSILHLCRLTDKKSQSQFPYWVPKKDIVDRNILTLLFKQFTKLLEYQKELKAINIAKDFSDLKSSDVLLINKPVQEIGNSIPDNSIDFVITDPPYYDQIAYSEYLKIWEFFLGYKSDLSKEIVVSNNKLHRKTHTQYIQDMKIAFNIIASKLKENGKIFVYFKDSNLDKTSEIISLIEETGLCYTESIHLTNKLYTYKQNTTKKTSIVGNNVLCFKKMKQENFNQKIQSVIHNEKEFLQELLEGHLFINKSLKLSSIFNLIMELQRQYSFSEPFIKSKDLAKWLDTFLTYDPTSRSYCSNINNPTDNHMFLGDSLEVLQKIPDESIDACITDPPYNIKGKRTKEIGWYNSNLLWKETKGFNKISQDWDDFSESSYEEFTSKWLKEIKRVVKKNGNIAIFGSYHNIFMIGSLLESMDFRVINSIVWYKRNAFPNITQRMFCESTEYIIWAVNNSSSKAKNWTFNYKEMKDLNGGKQMRNMWDIPNTPNREKKFGKHPSQKPLEVLNRLILSLTKKDDLIIDPFLGSGTTALSALMNNRKYIGIDNNLEYLVLANNRIRNRDLSLDLNQDGSSKH